MVQLIGLCGKAGSGKDAVADILVERYGFNRIKVATKIREEVGSFLQYAIKAHAINRDFPPSFDIVLDVYISDLFAKPTSHPARTILQWWGSEYRRLDDEDYWLKKLEPTLKFGVLNYVITDVRYPNEIKKIREWGGNIWRVDRYGLGELEVGIPDHPTESAWMSEVFDNIIPNNGTLEDLQNAIAEIINSSHGKRSNT